MLISDFSAKKPKQPNQRSSDSAAIGLGAVFAAATLSAFASIYFELMLKKPPPEACEAHRRAAGLWTRNIQLGTFALPLAAAAMIINDREQLVQYGLLHGFTPVVWGVVLLNGCGGLLVAATMKYADNIVKCFAAALAIITGTLVSVPLFSFELNRTFVTGAMSTVAASVLYARAPPCVCIGILRGASKQDEGQPLVRTGEEA